MAKNTQDKSRTFLKTLPARLHHNAYTTEDHEATRHFYEDILGIPLVAMYIEREFLEGQWVELGHAFYGLGDGGALAFFNFADPAKQEEWRAKQQSIFVHLSLLVDEETQNDLRARIKAADCVFYEIDHGYCTSIYTVDPNGLRLEFTVDPPDAAAINEKMRRNAHEDLRRWIAGDRTSNNLWRKAPPEAAAE